MTKHFMVDIETLSTKSNAVVLSIGAVNFDPYSLTQHDEQTFYAELNLEQQANRDVSISTAKWWMEQIAQSPSGISVFTKENKVQVRNALLLLRDFFNTCMEGEKGKVVWACDPDFDLTILSNLFAEYKLDHELPWKYNEARSVRTVRMLEKEFFNQAKKQEASHNALDDCLRQVKEIKAFYQAMRG